MLLIDPTLVNFSIIIKKQKNKQTMKKTILAIGVVTMLASCVGSVTTSDTGKTDSTSMKVDSTAKSVDSTHKKVDTTAVK
mgnify:CR=1 FL=1